MVEKKFNIGWILRNLVLWFVVLVTLFPIIHMMAVSLSGSMDVYKGSVSFLPVVDGKIGISLDVYKMVFENKFLFRAYGNTILYTVLGTFFALFTLSTGAYALSKPNRTPFGKFINYLVLITMFFGGGMIPTFLTLKWLGMLNTIWAVVVPGAFGAYNCIIMRSFFVGFPKEIEESGRLDGLNDIGILWYLVLPTSTAVLSTIGLFVAVGQWNSFMGPLLYLNDEAMHPLQIVLRGILLQSNMEQYDGVSVTSKFAGDAVKYATIAVAVAPIMAVYPFLQKYFVKGVMIGSVKG